MWSAGANYPMRFAGYLARHWRGECPLAVAFWVNFVALFVAFGALERFTLPPHVRGETAVTIAAAGFFAARLGVYAWQVTGVLRACGRYRREHTDRTWAVAAEGAVVLSLAAILAAGFSSYQSWLDYRLRLRAPEPAAVAPAVSLDLVDSEDGKLLHLRGPLQTGITRRVSEMLAAHPQVTGMILDSGGGRIYEGRGLARVIAERGLATYSLRECASSCATAFVAGATRALGRGARLGFHRYKNYAALPVVDIDAEHAKDLALFEAQGVSAEFLGKIFARAPEMMWWPPVEELIEGGVVHRVGFSIDDDGGAGQE